MELMVEGAKYLSYSVFTRFQEDDRFVVQSVAVLPVSGPHKLFLGYLCSSYSKPNFPTLLLL
jgi:hypothetical protein